MYPRISRLQKYSKVRDGRLRFVIVKIQIKTCIVCYDTNKYFNPNTYFAYYPAIGETFKLPCTFLFQISTLCSLAVTASEDVKFVDCNVEN